MSSAHANALPYNFNICFNEVSSEIITVIFHLDFNDALTN